jgi:hypothetical protein
MYFSMLLCTYKVLYHCSVTKLTTIDEPLCHVPSHTHSITKRHHLPLPHYFCHIEPRLRFLEASVKMNYQRHVPFPSVVGRDVNNALYRKLIPTSTCPLIMTRPVFSGGVSGQLAASRVMIAWTRFETLTSESKLPGVCPWKSWIRLKRTKGHALIPAFSRRISPPTTCRRQATIKGDAPEVLSLSQARNVKE